VFFETLDEAKSLIALPVVIHFLKSLEYFLLLFLFPGVKVFLQEAQRYLTEDDFERLHLTDFPLQTGQLYR
jgi:hypothetical protein